MRARARDLHKQTDKQTNAQTNTFCLPLENFDIGVLRMSTKVQYIASAANMTQCAQNKTMARIYEEYIKFTKFLLPQVCGVDYIQN